MFVILDHNAHTAGHEHPFILLLFLSRLARTETRSEGKGPYNHFDIQTCLMPGRNPIFIGNKYLCML